MSDSAAVLRFELGFTVGVDWSAASVGDGGLVEREAERVVIAELLAAAGRGSGGLLLVEGPAGIGKTRLLRIARDQAVHLGLGVLSASGSELERAFRSGY
jgi:DNA helicase TIP49 (TBP-interacting protein)